MTSTPIAGSSDSETDHLDAFDIDPHRRAYFAVMDHRKQQLALPCARQHEGQCDADEDRDNDQQSVVHRVRKIADIEIAKQTVRLIRRIGLHAPYQLDHVFEDQKH